MPHRELQALLTAIDAAEADAAALVQGLSEAQGNWRPGGGAGWSIAQCLDHLARINQLYVGHFLPVVQRAYRDERRLFTGLRPTWFGRTFVRILEPPVKQKAKAPARAQPAPSIPLAEALERYVASHAKYRDMVELCEHVDVNRAGASNPFFGVFRVRVATALLVTPAHDRRHLWQARQVLAAPDFPR